MPLVVGSVCKLKSSLHSEVVCGIAVEDKLQFMPFVGPTYAKSILRKLTRGVQSCRIES
jgi:hypothetical protein